MREVRPIGAEALDALPLAPKETIRTEYKAAMADFSAKIVVLDDDPTGIQTVHGVPVYTEWDRDSILDGFRSESRTFFLLTNSRALSARESREVHECIAERVVKASEETGKDFVLVSRGDSTLRGHYPLEPDTLKNVAERLTGRSFRGEIVIPFFPEGGRYTLDGIHYVRSGDTLMPAGMTEFAKDKTFSYRASDLSEWIEEKTGGACRAEDVVPVSIEELRARDCEGIYKKLTEGEGYLHLVVSAAEYCDLEAFAVPLVRAMKAGFRYVFRSAAALPKVLGNVDDAPLLTREQLVPDGSRKGGLLVIGSHVGKTTAQLAKLKESDLPIEYVEFNQHLVLEEGGLERETERVSRLASELIAKGVTAAVYTRRERVDLKGFDPEGQLALSVRISRAVTGVVEGLTERPSFLIAKGGITSSEIGTRALGVKKAIALGQIRPGVPVWQTGPESRFPFLPYVIFPGNVGTDDDLTLALGTLMK